MKLNFTTLKTQNGGSAVEFAIILPLLLLLVFGIVEWSVYLFDDHIITDASRAGARHGITQAFPRVSAGEIQAQVLSYIGGNLVTFGTQNTPQVEVKVGASPSSCTVKGDELIVKVNYTYTFLALPVLSAGIIPQSRTISAATVMRCE